MATKVTMSMIAQKAQVSQPTVSIVLNHADSISISDETKKRVLDAALELGYTKKVASHRPNRKKIAFIIDGALYCYDHFLLTLNAAMERSLELNISLKTLCTLSTNEGEDMVFEDIKRSRYDAIIVATNMTNDISAFTDLNTPTVFLNCLPKEHKKHVISVMPDDYQNARKLALAIAPYYKRPLIIAGDNWMKATQDRLKALQDVYNEFNNPLLLSDVHYCSWSFREACSIVVEQLKEDPSYDVIFCASDYVALGVYQALSLLNMKVGKDIAVVGYDNQNICKELSPQLTSVELPYDTMGRLALEYAYALSNGKKVEKDKVRNIQGELVIRASSPRARTINNLANQNQASSQSFGSIDLD